MGKQKKNDRRWIIFQSRHFLGDPGYDSFQGGNESVLGRMGTEIFMKEYESPGTILRYNPLSTIKPYNISLITY